MNEIYWITRFGSIHTLSTICMIIGIICSIIVTILYYACNGQRIYDETHGYQTSAEEHKGYVNTCKNTLKWSIPITIFLSLLSVFTPTTKEALAIWGVGGTIDYLKSNPAAKKLPDKCINALDKWVDSWTEKEDSVAHK